MTAGRRAAPFGLAALGAAFALHTVGFGSPYALRVAAIAGVFAIASIGYQVIFGHAGALALSQGTFMGVGAYVAGLLDIRFGLSFGAALPFSIAAAAALAALVAVPVFRLRTHYFALATLIIGQILVLVATSWENVTGGANGLGGISGFAILGAQIPAGRSTLLLIWTFVAIAAIAAWRLTRGQHGLAFALLRTNENAARSIGLDTAALRAAAFVLSAACAGIAGALYVHVVRVISPDILEFPVMLTVLTITVIGGRRDILGAIVAAVLIVELPEWFRFLRQDYLLAYGVLLLAVAVAAPDGLLHVSRGRWPKKFFEARRHPRRTPGIHGLLSWRRAKVVDRRPSPTMTMGAGPRSTDVLVVERLTKSFGGIDALQNVSFSMSFGEIVGLIGPNGSGKTTLLNAVTGLVLADRGKIIIDGRDMTRAPPHRIARAGLARGFQATALVDALSARDNVAVACPRDDPAQWLDAAGARDTGETAAGSLSFGDKRRVELARALATRPKLLLLDEPASGLTPAERADLSARLRGCANAGLSILVVEHDIAFLAGLADRLICLDGGRVIADGATNAVRSDPRVIAAYLGG